MQSWRNLVLLALRQSSQPDDQKYCEMIVSISNASPDHPLKISFAETINTLRAENERPEIEFVSVDDQFTPLLTYLSQLMHINPIFCQLQPAPVKTPPTEPSDMMTFICPPNARLETFTLRVDAKCAYGMCMPNVFSDSSVHFVVSYANSLHSLTDFRSIKPYLAEQQIDGDLSYREFFAKSLNRCYVPSTSTPFKRSDTDIWYLGSYTIVDNTPEGAVACVLDSVGVRRSFINILISGYRFVPERFEESPIWVPEAVVDGSVSIYVSRKDIYYYVEVHNELYITTYETSIVAPEYGIKQFNGKLQLVGKEISKENKIGVE